jgi:DNA-binding NarL/FixJ family response regulator
MAEGRSNLAIAQKLYLSQKTVEAHAAAIFTKLDLPVAADDNRRVLAVLTWLRRPSRIVTNPALS